MKARHIILTIAAIAILAGPATVLAQMGPGDGPGRHGGGRPGDHLGFLERALPRMAEELGLSDQQLAEIEAIVDEARPKIEAYAEQLREGRETYREGIEDPTYFDEEKFRAHTNSQHEIQTELGVVAGQAKANALKKRSSARCPGGNFRRKR